MAYITTERVKLVRQKIKPILKKYGFTGTIRREHYSTVNLSVKSNGRLINEYATEKLYSRHAFQSNWNSLTVDEQQRYFKFIERESEINKIKSELEDALKLSDWYDNSDIMTDYFDVDYYTNVNVIN